ncbi:hypothetical protein A5906_05345 [Bradyrhizobium sacchari]|uniref:hypothetical protein n=1 Tax=Bradyrhizobium sacchari TaxID=1399419 RepID=UPI0009AF285E|nr:hypothetical protein [Bradyrhizobium sacchari]OPY96009.1 hypothetical protein A5906_05345 [Bradyrhizobium sacchari]
MLFSQVCSAANTASLARALISLGRLGAIATAGVRVAHPGTAMLGQQMQQRADGTLSPVRDCRALACVKDILNRAARSGARPQATYPMAMDAQASVARQQAIAHRLRLFEFTPNRQHLASAGSHGQT